MSTQGNLRINSARLWDSLMEMAKIGATPGGGCNRQTLTDVDREGRALFRRWCEEAGLTVGVDDMGTMFARRPGRNNDLAPVATGSHLDTQPTGGKYDGVLGVLAGLEVVRTLNELGIVTERPIEVINWTNEEGCRFGPAMLASGVFAGTHPRDWALARKDAQGTTFGEALNGGGFAGDEKTGARKLHAYVELHIEQGPILEAEGCEIGVVTTGQGFRWFDVAMIGRDSHTGATPMARRFDALLGASRIVERVHQIALAHPNSVGTVGFMEVSPNSRNVIPGLVKFTVDFRHVDGDALTKMADEFVASAQAIAAAQGLEITIDPAGAQPPVHFNPDILNLIRTSADESGYKHRDIASGAGHDAFHIAKVAPSAMIFCPCVEGLSHNEAEEIFPEWAKAGADVLLQTLVTLARA